MKTKKKFNHIWEDLYKVNVWWFVGSRKQYGDLVRKEFKLVASDIDDTVRGRVEYFTVDGQPLPIIWLPKKDITCLAHEVFHVVHWIMKYKGIYLSDDSNEAYAYLLEYLMEEIMEKW
ncbi:hypothetical protein LCGC14_0475650 [marine sediment metagenome]|uniref:Metallopeptidase domain-containing protein n=1 Tax=marine sediment metagenome TaxID=412755 RepID=A0A0F9STX4_9ZZZZ